MATPRFSDAHLRQVVESNRAWLDAIPPAERQDYAKRVYSSGPAQESTLFYALGTPPGWQQYTRDQGTWLDGERLAILWVPQTRSAFIDYMLEAMEPDVSSVMHAHACDVMHFWFSDRAAALDDFPDIQILVPHLPTIRDVYMLYSATCNLSQSPIWRGQARYSEFQDACVQRARTLDPDRARKLFRT